LNQLLSYVIQEHKAKRAGKHFDIRLGPDRGNAPTMMSWAARKLPEQPGHKTLAFQQPLHTGTYSKFEGKLDSGYGAGTVATHDRGQVTVTKANPGQINFEVADSEHPKKFMLLRQSGPPTGGTARTRKTQGGNWLLVRVAPTIARDILPRAGKLKAPSVSKGGIGFTEATRKQMREAPKESDYPAAKAASLVKRAAPPDVRLLRSYANMGGPTSLRGLAGDLGVSATIVPTITSAGTTAGHLGAKALAGMGMKSMAPSATLAAKLGTRWAPAALAGNLKNFIGKRMLPLAVALEGAGNVWDATKDPEYKAGRKGLLRSIGGSIGRGSEASQAKTQDALKKGLLTGTLTSAFRGISTPISTTTGLLQSLGRALKAPFTSKSSSSKVLAPVIKHALAEIDGEGETMEDLVKAAFWFARSQPTAPTPAPPPAPPVPEAPVEAPKPISFGDRFRGLILGMDPKTLQSLRSGAKSVAGIVDKLRTAGILQN